MTDKPTLRYTRRRDRVLALIWPAKRKQLRQTQLLFDALARDREAHEAYELSAGER